jgi:hypothetical protein
MAEREGFEPSVPFWGTHAFQAGAIGHSATSPRKELKGKLVPEKGLEPIRP